MSTRAELYPRKTEVFHPAGINTSLLYLDSLTRSLRVNDHYGMRSIDLCPKTWAVFSHTYGDLNHSVDMRSLVKHLSQTENVRYTDQQVSQIVFEANHYARNALGLSRNVLLHDWNNAGYRANTLPSHITSILINENSGDIMVDNITHPRYIGPKELDVLYMLAEKAERIVTNTAMAEAMRWDESRTANRYGKLLINKLEVDPKNPRHIINYFGRGYMMQDMYIGSYTAPIIELLGTEGNIKFYRERGYVVANDQIVYLNPEELNFFTTVLDSDSYVQTDKVRGNSEHLIPKRYVSSANFATKRRLMRKFEAVGCTDVIESKQFLGYTMNSAYKKYYS